MSRPRNLLMIILALLIIQGMLSPTVAAQNAEEPPSAIERGFVEVGLFTYQAKFTFDDGTELFTLRSAYRASYLYQQTKGNHFLSVSFGFYFGKTVIGRSVVQSFEFDKISYYPKWKNSAGYSFDFLGDVPLAEINGSIEDAEVVNEIMLIDNEAITRMLPMFGGTYVFTNLTVVLDGGEIIDFGEDDIQIAVEQYGNEFSPRDAVISGGDNLEYETESGIVLINSQASAPFILLLDMILGIFLLGTSGVIVILTILHQKGKIVLPLDRFKGALIRQMPDTDHHKI